TFHRFANSLLNRWDVFARDNPTNNFVFKFETCAFFVWFKPDMNMTILSAATRLPDKLTFNFGALTEGFAISYLRITDVCFHFKFGFQAVNDNVKMEFSHSGDNCLTSLNIRLRLKRRIFFSQFA